MVFLRGLDIFGVNPPTNGVRFIAGGALHIEDSTIRRFNAANSNGVSFAPSGASRLYITRTTIADNGNGTTGNGILIQPAAGAAGTARVTLTNVRILNNGGSGVRVDTTGNSSGSGVVMNVVNSEISGNTVNGVALVTPSSFAIANVSNSMIFNNPTAGLSVNGAEALIRATGNLISLNGAAVSIAGGGSIRSYGDNVVEDNTTPSSFVAPDLVKD